MRKRYHRISRTPYRVLVEDQPPIEGRINAGHRRGSDRALAQVARQVRENRKREYARGGQEPAGGSRWPRVAGDVLTSGFGEGLAAGGEASEILIASPRDGSTEEATNE